MVFKMDILGTLRDYKQTFHLDIRVPHLEGKDPPLFPRK
jgi:hypothetical protein